MSLTATQPTAAPPAPADGRPALAGPCWPAPALACALVLGSGAVRWWQARQVEAKLAGERESPFPLESLPMTLGDWAGEKTELDPLIVARTGSNDLITRRYVNQATGVALDVIVMHGPASEVFIHSPTNCYPQAGYTAAGDATDRPVRGPDGPVTFRSVAYTKGDPAHAETQEVYFSWRYNGHWTPVGRAAQGDAAGRGDVQGPGRAAADARTRPAPSTTRARRSSRPSSPSWRRGSRASAPAAGRAPSPEPTRPDAPRRHPPMNHPDRPPGPPMRRTPSSSPPTAAYDLDMAGADLPAAGKKITVGLVARAVRRHWWQAALLWLVGSVAAMALVYLKVKPTYLSFSRVRVEPAARGLFGQGSDVSFEVFKETQVNLISSPTVIEAALAGPPRAARLPPARRGRRPGRRDPRVARRGRRPGDQPDRGRDDLRVAAGVGGDRQRGGRRLHARAPAT